MHFVLKRQNNDDKSAPRRWTRAAAVANSTVLYICTVGDGRRTPQVTRSLVRQNDTHGARPHAGPSISLHLTAMVALQ